MKNKILAFLIIVNLFLYIGRIWISMWLSTQGDELIRINYQIAHLKTEIDLLETQTVQASNLDKAFLYAKNRGFIQARIVRFSSENLAHAQQN